MLQQTTSQPSRSCGECRECCIQYDIEEFDKPAGTPCQHLCKTGCGIYADRPKACSELVCAWLLGKMGINDKPSKTKMVCTAGVLDGGLVVYGTYADKPHKKTVKFLMGESYKYPVLIGKMGCERTLYVNGKDNGVI